MKPLSFTAPGKVVVCGEYAVLDGAAAICMAVNRRARVKLSPGNVPGQHTVTAPGHVHGPVRFEAGRDRFAWLDDGTGLSVVEQVWRAGRFAPAASLALELDTGAFLDSSAGSKLGIGSSAAVTVALTAALTAAAAHDECDVSGTALAAHRDLQQGRGSGVDIACSICGGIILYRRAEPPAAVCWPEGLRYRLFWSGIPASTRERLVRLPDGPARKSRTALAEAAERAAATWQGGSAAGMVTALQDYTRALRAFGIDHQLGIFDAGHAELAAAAPESVAYKPCGAGGGDIGIALSADTAALEGFVETAIAGGFRPMGLTMDPAGVTQERGPD